jgi:hypothetical protein
MPLPYPAATGLLSPNVDGILYLLAASPTFQAVVAAPSADAALASIYWYEARDEQDPHAPPDAPALVEPRPRAILELPHAFGRYRNGPGTWNATGAAELSFEFLAPPGIAGDNRREARWFSNVIGAITQEMTDASGASAGNLVYANISKMELTLGPAQCRFAEEIEEFWAAVFCLEWPGRR